MRLRKIINRPQKLQDEMVFGKDLNDPTKPAFPNLLRSQVVPFNPLLPPAAFPSLPLPRESNVRGDGETSVKQVANIKAQSVEVHTISDDDALPNWPHSKSRRVPSLDSPSDVPFEDEMVSSDENEDNVRNNNNDAQPSKTKAVDGGHLDLQVTKANTLNWKYLSSAVRLAIINTMSQHYPLTKVYDMLGLYAQELGDIRKLVIQYNHQTEMEDYLAFWMQQDQLNGILRTDHTSTLREAPETYQEFQTQSYMRKIQSEVDESLLHATLSEVNLGKRFLAEQGIRPEMIGSWKSVYSYTYAARSHDHKIHLPTRSLRFRSGLDSGYVSAINSPNMILTSQDADHAPASSPRNDIQTGRAMGSRRASKPMNTRAVRLLRMASPAEVHKARLCKSHDPHSDTPSPAEDPSSAGSSGRSRRNIRPNPRYEEAMAELKLQGRVDGVRSDYATIPEKVATPSPLPRVIVRPPKAVSKPKQPNIIPQPPEVPATNRFNQSLLGMPCERNGVAKSLLNAAERDTANATPWISVQQKDVTEPMLPPVSDPQKRSGTVVAPAFSPITERFPNHWNQGPQGTEASVHTSHETVRSRTVLVTANEGIINSSLPVTPGLISSPTPVVRNSEWNGRSIVTETGSPVPHGRGKTSNALSAGKQNGTTTAHEETSVASISASRKPQTGPARANVPRKLNPITGNIILDPLTQVEPSRAASPGERSPTAPTPKEPVTPAPHDGEGEGQNGPAAPTNATEEPSKITRPTTDPAAKPPKGTRRRGAPKSVMRTTELPSQPDVGEKKRKYSKSEAQKQKEASKLERERREREARFAAKAAGEDAKAKKTDRRAVAAVAAAPAGDLAKVRE